MRGLIVSKFPRAVSPAGGVAHEGVSFACRQSLVFSNSIASGTRLLLPSDRCVDFALSISIPSNPVPIVGSPFAPTRRTDDTSARMLALRRHVCTTNPDGAHNAAWPFILTP